MNKTKKELLEQALKETVKYVHGKDADLAVVSNYLRDLADWIDEPEIESSDPIPPPPPPPGHK
jgi:hypothetical protein